MKFLPLICLATLATSAIAQGKHDTYMTDAVVMEVMTSQRHCPPENLPLTASQHKAQRAILDGASKTEKAVLIQSMRNAYYLGPMNRHELSDAELRHLLLRKLEPRERKTMTRFLNRLLGSQQYLVKRMFLNMTVRLA